MAGMIDKVFLLIWATVMVFDKRAEVAPVVAMLLGVLVAALGNGEWKQSVRMIGALLFAAGCFFLPELVFFLPVVFYDCCKERRLWWICATGPVLGVYHWGSGLDGRELGVWILSLAAAVMLSRRTEWAEYLSQEMIRIRDTETELNLVLREKNKDLLEKQDYEIYLATLRERNRIAREIHDNVGHMLSRSILQIGALSTIYRGEPLHEQLGSVNQTLNQAMDAIRESVHNLHDDSIDLQQAVGEATQEMKAQYRLSIDYDMSPEVTRSVKYCFIATIKEAMSNIVKHSDADCIHLVLREHPGFYQLTIEDNGKVVSRREGLLENRLVRGADRGMGLENMRERVEALHGTLHIRTEKGFVIFISIPKEVPGRVQEYRQ